MTAPSPVGTAKPAALLALGDEAVALGARDAGIGAAYAYPGTPSTEILERLLADPGPYTASWCANEKTAYEAALGTSFAGRRALVAMKHVGLNVAADPFVNSALLGLGGGLVLAVADDPGMASSQNEQDSRFYADFAHVPCLEPADPQEAYDMTLEAFHLSERLGLPVVVRLVTHVAHVRMPLSRRPPLAATPRGRAADRGGWVLLPANARRRFRHLLELQPELRAWAEASPWNRLELHPGERRIAVVTTGIGRTYLAENLPELPEPPSHLHLGAYPMPEDKLRALAGSLDDGAVVLVVEEGFPLVERALAGVLPGRLEVRGRLSGHLPADGGLSPGRLRAALGLARRPTLAAAPGDLPARPPQLCPGCPHRDSFEALELALAGSDHSAVLGDIGCYTLGALPPFSVLESCVDMGASIAMARGASEAGLRPAVAVIGDSTFLHSGIPPLLDAVVHDTDMTVLLLDNESVAMTGGQPTLVPTTRLGPLLLGLGVPPEHCRVLEAHPKNVEGMARVLTEEIAHPGLSVVVSVRECIEATRRRKAAARRRNTERRTA